VRQVLDNPALTTDVIVGFPGETEADFQATCEVAEAVGFSKIHIFPFSPRKTTAAAEMTGQVSPAVKSERAQRLAELEATLRERYFASLLGRHSRVLVETASPADGTVAGTTGRYAPCELPGGADSIGTFVPVRVERVAGGRLVASRC
jgi:threonylcarbamoyladenosine tRNA methylthiotransferase MtaB